ncbi:hypothetical protein J7J12_01960 [bacterium]|nr:hypothetical protein [bacterium]MCD6284000.1 hypothetical protein [bacterium]
MERIEKIIPKKPELPISQEKEKSFQEKKENLLLKNLLDDFRMLFQDEKIITSDLESLKEKIKEKQIISDAHIFDVLKNLGMILGNQKKIRKEIIFHSKNALRDYLFLLNQDEEFLKGELKNKLGAYQEFGKMSLFSYIEISKNLFELKELNQDIREETEDLIKRGIIRNRSQRKHSLEEVRTTREIVRSLIECGVKPKITVPIKFVKKIKKEGIKETSDWLKRNRICGTLLGELYLPKNEKRAIVEIEGISPSEVEPLFTPPDYTFKGTIEFKNPIPPEKIKILETN